MRGKVTRRPTGRLYKEKGGRERESEAEADEGAEEPFEVEDLNVLGSSDVGVVEYHVGAKEVVLEVVDDGGACCEDDLGEGGLHLLLDAVDGELLRAVDDECGEEGGVDEPSA